jgi:hypothetical protein
VKYTNFNFDTEHIAVSVIIILLLGYSIFRANKIVTDGIYTICQVDHFESAESGVNLYIELHYQGKKIKRSVDSFCGGCDGRYFFVRIIKNQPNSIVLFLSKYPVPDCILNDSIPFEGWKEIPTCR